MALWFKVQQLPRDSLHSQQIRSIYGEHFPIEVRHCLAHFIEEKFGGEKLPNLGQHFHEGYVSNLVNQLIQQLEMKAKCLNDAPEQFAIKIRLTEAAKMFRERYSSNPLQLYNFICQCLTQEIKLLESAGAMLIDPAAVASGPKVDDIFQRLNLIRGRTEVPEKYIRQLHEEFEAFGVQYQECTKIKAHLQQLRSPAATNASALQYLSRKDYLKSELNGKLAGMVELRMKLTEEFGLTLRLVSQLQTQVLDNELMKWKREQQLSGNGYPFNNNLDQIQSWCECLVETIWITRQQIKEVELIKQKLSLGSTPIFADSLPSILTDMTKLLYTMVTETFIIDKQPPQVMKTNTRFTASVRLLVGNKLNTHMTSPTVNVSIISETQANIIIKSKKLPKSSNCAGEIVNNTGRMEIQPASNQMTATFRSMQLKRIKRAEKKGTESVMDEKFALLFQSSFSVGGGELVFQVWVMSLPVVVIVHGNQEPYAWATITWDNGFCEPNRAPFEVPDKVPWSKIRESLSQRLRFFSGRGLNDDNMRFLGEKLFRGNFIEGTNPLVSWSQFCKEPLPDKNFTFWEWFFAVVKLTKDHLRGHWAEGAIMGFIKKNIAEAMLTRCRVGTFLLRFSDNTLGGITIAWISDTRDVYSLIPFTARDLGLRSLANRLNDLKELNTVFPDTPKDVYFGKYYSVHQSGDEKLQGDYQRSTVITRVLLDKDHNTAQGNSFRKMDPHRDTF